MNLLYKDWIYTYYNMNCQQSFATQFNSNSQFKKLGIIFLRIFLAIKTYSHMGKPSQTPIISPLWFNFLAQSNLNSQLLVNCLFYEAWTEIRLTKLSSSNIFRHRFFEKIPEFSEIPSFPKIIYALKNGLK